MPPQRNSSKLKPGAMEEEQLPSSSNKKINFFDTGKDQDTGDKKKRKRLTKDRIQKRKELAFMSSSDENSLYNSNDEYIPPA